jgi:hypothetical protein
LLLALVAPRRAEERRVQSSKRLSQPTLALGVRILSALPLASALARSRSMDARSSSRVCRGSAFRVRARRLRLVGMFARPTNGVLNDDAPPVAVHRTARLERTRERAARDEGRRDASNRARERNGEMKAS